MTGWRTTLSDRLTAAAERHDVPGASIAVGHGGELIEAATGVLNRETGVAVTSDSLFHVGSSTKPWTAALVLQLAYEGVIDLDAPIFGHDGDVPGESTVWLVLPEHDLVVAMSINRNPAGGMVDDPIVPLFGKSRACKYRRGRYRRRGVVRVSATAADSLDGMSPTGTTSR